MTSPQWGRPTPPRRTRRYRHSRSYTGWGSLVVVILAAVALVASCLAQTAHDHVATCTILDKDRGASRGSSSHYRVYTRQCGTLKNEDQIALGKTDSADLQGRLQVGHTYRLRIVGYRFSPTSQFPNIISIEGEVPS